MLVAIKSKKISKLLALNSKNERVLINIPLNEWVVVDSITNVSKILNYDAIISNGGQVYTSLWKTTPPFGREGQVKYIRSTNTGGFTVPVIAIFSDLKSQSQDAIAEEALEVSNVVDKAVQNTKSSELVDIFEKNITLLSNRIAYLKAQKDKALISQDTYNTEIVSLTNKLIFDINTKVYDFVGAVIGEDISNLAKNSLINRNR